MTLIIFLYMLWAWSVTSSKEILHYTQPIFLTGSRMFLAGIILLVYQYFYAHEHFTFKRKDIWLYFQIAFFGVFLSNVLRFWALGSMTASKSMFLFNAAPFVSSLYSYFIFNESMSKRQWIGLFLGIAGLVPILMNNTPAESSVGEWFSISWAEVATLVSVAAHSYHWIVMRTLVREHSYSPMMINGMCMFAGGAMALVTAFFVEGAFPVTDVLPFSGLLLFIILISNIICHNLYGYLLRTYTATFLSFCGFMGPIFAAITSWILKGELITWHFYVSSVIVFIALYLFYKDEAKVEEATMSFES